MCERLPGLGAGDEGGAGCGGAGFVGEYGACTQEEREMPLWPLVMKMMKTRWEALDSGMWGLLVDRGSYDE